MNELQQLKELLIQLTKTCDTNTLVALARVLKEIDQQEEELKKIK